MNKLRFILILLSLLLISGCKMNMESMLDDYNGNFTVEDDRLDKRPVPGDSDFDQRDMLYDTYCVGSNETVNLAGPLKCNSYSWVVTDVSALNAPEVRVKFFDGSYDSHQRLFVTYIPESGLQVGKTYKLTLTVTDKDENVYTDSCELVIYQHYDFETEKPDSEQ